MGLDLLGVFGAGALTFITPCVLPLIPITLAALAGGDPRTLGAGGRGQVLARAAWFALGFELVFVALGLGATSLGAFLVEHKAALQAAGALLIALFGLKFLGVIRIRWLDATARADGKRLQTRFGWLNALLMGLVFAAGWSPCVGPVLGSVLTYTATTTADPLLGALYLGVYGLGFAVPLLLLAGFAELGSKLLAKLAPQLRKIELALGALLLLVAAAMAGDALPALTAAEPAPAAAQHTAAKPRMLAFTSPDCPVCKRMKPLLQRVEQQCDGRGVHVEVVDVSRAGQRALAQKHRLVGLPTFVFVAPDGAEVARLVGEQSPRALERALSALRGEPCPGLAILDESGGHLHPDDLLPPSTTPAQPGPACPPDSTRPACEGA
jgi:cytochrome c-type biogenesis protein